jgi:hypothetical protein
LDVDFTPKTLEDILLVYMKERGWYAKSRDGLRIDGEKISPEVWERLQAKLGGEK